MVPLRPVRLSVVIRACADQDVSGNPLPLLAYPAQAANGKHVVQGVLCVHGCGMCVACCHPCKRWGERGRTLLTLPRLWFEL